MPSLRCACTIVADADGRAPFAVLGHRRLAIIDTSDAGLQPMGGPGASPWIVYNGETYNFAALRAELEQRQGSASTVKTDLAPGSLTRHSGEQAASFRKRLEEAAASSRGRLRTAGGARERFTVHNEFLRPRVQWNSRGEMELDFILGALRLPNTEELAHQIVAAVLAFVLLMLLLLVGLLPETAPSFFAHHAIMSTMSRFDASGGKMYVPRLRYSLTMSFWVVPRSCLLGTPWAEALAT